MEKRVFCELNGNRKVIGVLRGYDVRRTELCVFYLSFKIPATQVLGYSQKLSIRHNGNTS